MPEQRTSLPVFQYLRESLSVQIGHLHSIYAHPRQLGYFFRLLASKKSRTRSKVLKSQVQI